jgi:hypothetical protein
MMYEYTAHVIDGGLRTVAWSLNTPGEYLGDLVDAGWEVVSTQLEGGDTIVLLRRPIQKVRRTRKGGQQK